MRHRSLNAEYNNGNDHHEAQDRRNSLAANPRKHHRLYYLNQQQKDWMMAVKFGLCFFVLSTILFAIVHSIPRSTDKHSLIRKVQQPEVDATMNNLSTNDHVKIISQKQAQDDKLRIQANHKKCPYGCPIIATEVSQLQDNSFETDAISQSHIILTHKSNRLKPAPVNQDRAIIISPFVLERGETEQLNGFESSDFLMGIFDGHDNLGHDVAQFAVNEVPKRIAQKLNDLISNNHILSNNTLDHIMVKSAIIQTFEEVDQAVPLEQSMAGGCTAHVILRLGSTLYMSNTGDSYSYLVTYTPPSNGLHVIQNTGADDLQPHLQGSITIHHQNIRHKPHLPEEKTRIEYRGGRIHIPPPPKNPMGSRVIVKSTVHNEDVGLAMSRSLGDAEWTKVGVTPTPDIEVVDLKEVLKQIGESSKLFAVVASDGLFDNRKLEFVTKHIARILFEADPSSAVQDQSTNMLELAKKLIAAASPVKEEWYRDDISLVARLID